MSRPSLNLALLKFSPADCGGYVLNAPTFLVEAFNIIERNVTTVGIFRMAGRLTRVQLVKNAFSGEEKIPEEVSVHDVCDAVKAFFRELEEPLLSSALQNQFLRSVNTIGREDVRARTILQLCRVLSQRHKDTLAFLMWRLKKVSEISHANKMDVGNLALVISMSIFRDDAPAKGQMQDAKTDTALKASVIEIMINHAESICRLAKRSEPIPVVTDTRSGSRSSSGVSRKPRVNTFVGVGDLPQSAACKVEHNRRKSGDWTEVCSKENHDPIPAEAQRAPLCDNGALLKGNFKGAQASTRRPWQRKLDTGVLNTSDSVEKAEVQCEVTSVLSRSVSDAAEKRQLNIETGQRRRRSAGMQAKIKRGQPNTVRTGLDKAKTKPSRGEQDENPVVLHSDLPLSPDLPDVVFIEPELAHSSDEDDSKPLVQSASAEQLNMEAEEAEDDFADFEHRKLELTAAKNGPPPSFSRLFRSPSTPVRDRPSVVFIRDRNRGRVLEQAAKYESVIQQRSSASATRQKSTEKKSSIPTFTQVPSGSKRCSPTKKYQTRMTVRSFNDNVKLQ